MTLLLDRAMTGDRDQLGRRRFTVIDEFQTPNETPNGGYLLMLVLRAIAEKAAHPDPLSVAITYMRPVVTGGVEVEVQELRVGRRISSYSALLFQNGTPCLQVTASFHDAITAGGEQLTDSRPPDLGDRESLWNFHEQLPDQPLRFLTQLDIRTKDPIGWLQDEPSGLLRSDWWLRLRDGRPADCFAIAFFCDCVPPLAFELGRHRGAATLQLNLFFRRRVRTEWVQMRTHVRHVIGNTFDQELDLWDDDGQLVAQARQIGILFVTEGNK